MATRLPLTIPEAARALALSEKTVRRMTKAGTLTEQGRDAAGRILITAQSIEAVAAQLDRAAIGWPEHPVSASSQLTPYAQPDPLQALGDTFARLLTEKDQRIYTLQDELAQLRAEQKFLPRISEAEHERVQALEQALTQAQQEIERLRDAGQTNMQVGTPAQQGTLISRIRRLLGFE